MKEDKLLKPFDIFLLAGIMVCMAVNSFLEIRSGGSFDWLGSLAGVAGVFCVVLVAKGSIWNYLFGLVNVTLYAYIAYKARIYGDAVLNAFYYLPMQFIGWWQWRRRGSGADSRKVRARRMSLRGRILLAAGCASLVAAGTLLLGNLDTLFGIQNDPQPLKDSTTTVLSLIAQALMAMAFMEQWALWIVTNVVSVAMWAVCIARGEGHAVPMLLMWSFYLMNSINGFVQWARLSREGADLAE